MGRGILKGGAYILGVLKVGKGGKRKNLVWGGISGMAKEREKGGDKNGAMHWRVRTALLEMERGKKLELVTFLELERGPRFPQGVREGKKKRRVAGVIRREIRRMVLKEESLGED